MSQLPVSGWHPPPERVVPASLSPIHRGQTSSTSRRPQDIVSQGARGLALGSDSPTDLRRPQVTSASNQSDGSTVRHHRRSVNARMHGRCPAGSAKIDIRARGVVVTPLARKQRSRRSCGGGPCGEEGVRGRGRSVGWPGRPASSGRQTCPRTRPVPEPGSAPAHPRCSRSYRPAPDPP